MVYLGIKSPWRDEESSARSSKSWPAASVDLLCLGCCFLFKRMLLGIRGSHRRINIVVKIYSKEG